MAWNSSSPVERVDPRVFGDHEDWSWHQRRFPGNVGPHRGTCAYPRFWKVTPGIPA